MSMNPGHLGLALAILLLASCGPKPQAAPEKRAAPPQVVHQIVGKVVRVDEAGYPTYAVVLAVRGEAKPRTLNVDAEDLDRGNKFLGDYVGRTVQVSYVTESKPNLLDMRIGARSLLGTAAPPRVDSGARSITGVLSGADKTTEGDVPGKITVTDRAGDTRTFQYFIPAEMVLANGKQVTASYIDPPPADQLTVIRLK